MFSKRAANLLLIGGLLTLSACGQQNPVGTAPEPTSPGAVTPKASLGVYQLSLTGQGQAITQATVGRVGGLQAQAAETTGLSFKSNNYGYYADQATGTLRMWATFDVTNNSGQDLAAPTLVPVDTDGAGGTIGTTAFKNVRYFDGSDASSRAPLLSFDESNDPKTTVKSPLLRNLDSGSIQVNLPVGMQLAGTAHSGWKMNALPAGATGQVTLATSIPLGATPQENPFSFDMVFTVADAVSPVTLTNIASIQGSTPAGDQAAALTGTQTVEGVVTAFLPGLSGFFVQEEGIDSDRNDATSDGIFVYCATSCPTLAVGDRVRVSGTVAEFSTGTQMTAPTVTKLTSGLTVPPAVELKLPLDRTQLERYEGMRVTFPETLTVTNNYTYGRYGQLDLSNNGRIFNPTNGNAKTGQSTITLDDGISSQNPGSLNYLSSENTRRTGDTVTGLSGIWHMVANTPMLEPEGPVNFVAANSRAANAQPKPVGGNLRVGGVNVLNYFTTYGSSTDRGANNAGELARQRAKMVTNLVTLDAHVLTLMEIQNNGDTAVDDVVAALNEKAGPNTYAAVKTGKVGTDAIKVAIIYQPAKVTPVGAPMIDNNSVFSRPPVAQTFRDRTTNGVFSVVTNHFKSKGSCPSSGDTDQGQGCWNNLRVNQANALLNFVNTIKQTSGDPDVLITGDLNAYGAEDPIKALQSGGFESLNLRIPAEDRYSYQFNGQFGYLDHALASQNLSGQVTGITEWHVNSDEPTIADYNVEFKNAPGCTSTTCTGIDLFDPSHPFRASDHDPVLVGLNLTADAGTTPVNPVTTLTASPAALTVTAGGAAVSSTLTTSTQNYSGADLTVTITTPVGVTVTPSATTVSPNGTFTVSVTAPEGTAAGTYPVTVTTKGDNGLKASTDLNVTVGTGGGTTTPTVGKLVISEVYGGGGNNGATYTHDFIEIFNAGGTSVNLSGYSVQYTSATGTNWAATPLTNVTLAPGQYYLVQQAKGTGGTTPLPTPDTSGTIAMSGSAGQVILAERTTVVSGTTDPAVRDYVKFATSSNALSFSRINVCTDTDATSDFASGSVTPQNTASPLAPCQ